MVFSSRSRKNLKNPGWADPYPIGAGSFRRDDSNPRRPAKSNGTIGFNDERNESSWVRAGQSDGPQSARLILMRSVQPNQTPPPPPKSKGLTGAKPDGPASGLAVLGLYRIGPD